MFTYIKMPDIPKVPDNFVMQALSIANINSNSDASYIDVGPGYRHRTIVHDGQELISRCQIACDMDESWHQWVERNITKNYIESGVRVNNDNGSSIHGPHTDPPIEKYKLYYLLETGGPNVVTEWYKELNHGVLRNPGTTVNDLSQVETIESIKIPLHTWILFNTNILHGVKNLVSQRVNLVVTISPTHPLLERVQI